MLASVSALSIAVDIHYKKCRNKRWVRWETEWSFDGKLYQNIHTKDYQNLIIGFQVIVENVRDAFLGHNVCNAEIYEARKVSKLDLRCL